MSGPITLLELALIGFIALSAVSPLLLRVLREGEGRVLHRCRRSVCAPIDGMGADQLGGRPSRPLLGGLHRVRGCDAGLQDSRRRAHHQVCVAGVLPVGHENESKCNILKR